MPVFEVTSPDGVVFEVTAPEGATEAQAISFAQQQHPQGTEAPPQPAPAAPATPQRSFMDRASSNTGDALRFLQKGVLLGAGDVAAAGLAAPIDYLKAQYNGTPVSLGDAYDQRLAYERQRMDQFKQNNPTAAAVSEMTGAMAPAAVAPFMASRAAVSGAVDAGRGMASRAIDRIVTPAVGGATYGGAYGFGSGRGGIENRLDTANEQAAVGAILGPVIPAGVSVAKGAGDFVASKLSSQFRGVRTDDIAALKVLQAIRRDVPANSPSSALYAARDQLDGMGNEGFIADLGNNTRSLAGAVGRIPGQGKTIINDAVTTRQEGVRGADGGLQGGQYGRISGLVDDLVPADYFAAKDATKAARKDLGASYEAARTADDVVDVMPILANLDQEIATSKGGIQSGLQKVRSYLVDSKGRPEIDINSLHQAKMAIDDLMSGEAKSSMGNVAKAKIRDYQNQIVDAIENSAGGASYREGRLGTAAEWRVNEALDTGRDFMTRATARSPEDLTS